MTIQTQTQRPVHTNIGSNIQRKVDEFHSNVIQEVIQHVNEDDVVVVGMAWNPFVSRAIKALNKANISYTYLGYGSYISGWKPRLSIKMWSGWPTFPQIFVKGTLIGGFTDLDTLLKSGNISSLLDTP